MDNVLLFFALKYQGDWENIYSALEQKEKISHEELIQVQAKIDCNFVTIINPLYPVNLKNSHKPPFVLFLKGNLNLLGNYHQIIGVSGGEQFNDYGAKNTQMMVQQLTQESRVILTGDSLGIEELVIKLVEKHHGRLIIVTAKGLKSYCEEHLELTHELEKQTDFLLVSERYESQEVTQQSNEYACRLKVGLMKTLLLTQISTTDRTYKMTNYILNDGKDLFAMPEPTHSRFNGGNLLIKQGAKMVDSVKDILNEI